MVICIGCVKGWQMIARESIPGHVLPPGIATKDYTAMRCFKDWGKAICPVCERVDCVTYEGASV